jgi:hypothetical protein
MVAFCPMMCCDPKVFWQKWNWFFLRLMCCGQKVLWQTKSPFLGHGSLLAFDVLWSKGLLADVELVFEHGSLLVFDVLRSKGLLSDVKPFFWTC